jgi:hypothetical protein
LHVAVTAHKSAIIAPPRRPAPTILPTNRHERRKRWWAVQRGIRPTAAWSAISADRTMRYARPPADLRSVAWRGNVFVGILTAAVLVALGRAVMGA